MGGQIIAYLDCVSPYSYFALLYLQKSRRALESHGVATEFVPVFLGGINVGSGNKPPWTLPAKAKYGTYDGKRAQKHFGVRLTTPSFFPILSLLPQRCMIFVKDKYSPEKYEASFQELWIAMWQQGHDISQPDRLANCLSRHFSSDDVKRILEAAGTAAVKQKLNDNTKKALGAGAFGCPFFEVTNSKGVTEPFFGSDRFHYMWQFLELPFQNLALQEKSQL